MCLLFYLLLRENQQALKTKAPHAMFLCCSSLVVLLAQRGHHHGQKLLESCLDLTSEFFTPLGSNHDGQTIGQQPEVVGIHVQFLRVQHTQLGIGCLDVVHVLHSPVHTVQDDFPVIRHHGISYDSSSVIKVSKVSKIPLSPGVDNQTPKESCRAHNFIVHPIKDVLDGGALELCPFNHDAGFWVL